MNLLRPFYGTTNDISDLVPAMNGWAIFNRPLTRTGASKRIFPKQADRFIVGYELRVPLRVLLDTKGEEIDDVLS
jgi:hypothetical protein